MIVQAIIPARGGSKGIRRKNLVELCGKPLLWYTIEDARRAPEISEIAVSTDDDEIAEYSARCGVRVIRRPRELSGDTEPSESALLHVLNALLEIRGRDPDLVVFLQATSPLRPTGAVSSAVKTLLQESADSLFSASPVHGFVWRMDRDGPAPLSYDHRHRPRRQEACEQLEENGSMYVFRPWVLRTGGNRLGGRISVHRMDPLYAAQVDEPGDLLRIETLMKARVHLLMSSSDTEHWR